LGTVIHHDQAVEQATRHVAASEPLTVA